MKDLKFILSHPELEQLDSGIWVIHNFTKPEEREVYLEIANSTKEEDWYERQSGWYHGKYLNVAKNNKLVQISENIIKRFSGLFEYGDAYSYGSPASIHRMLPGQEMFIHADFAELENADEDTILINSAIYHNRVEGGEIFYPEIGIEYHPQPGDLVLHLGTTRYRHGVKPVLGTNTRYISTLWVANDKGLRLKTSGSYSE